MDSLTDMAATECIDRMRSNLSPSDFGFQIQALAAHVLLRLDYEIVAVNHRGHPDITAILYGREYRFEVEAEVSGPRPRQLTPEDFESLTETPWGYYALAISTPYPYWVIVPVGNLVDRKYPSSNMLLEALSDKEYSAIWTRAYIELLRDAGRQIRLASFSDLRQLALAGNGL